MSSQAGAERDKHHYEEFYPEMTPVLIDMMVLDGESFQEWADRLIAEYGQIPFVRSKKAASPLTQPRDAYEQASKARHHYQRALVKLNDPRVANTMASKSVNG